MLPPAGLYADEEMEIEFRVENFETVDAAGAPTPLAFARIRAEADMPSMPSMAKFDEIAHREGIPGVFGVHPVFPHGGEYRLCLTILPPEVQPVGDPRPPTAYTFEFPLTVYDATSSPTPVPRRVRPYELEIVMSPRHPVAGEPVDLDLAVRMTRTFERARSRRSTCSTRSSCTSSSCGTTCLLRARAPGAGRVRRLPPALSVSGARAATGSSLTSRRRTPARRSCRRSSRWAAMPPAAGKTAAPDATRAALRAAAGGRPLGPDVHGDGDAHRRRGRPVRDLEPWLGAMGHMLLVNKDAETFAHAHPDDREPGVGENGRIPFLVRLPKPGRYKGWLQFQRRGRVETIELSIEAAPPH